MAFTIAQRTRMAEIFNEAVAKSQFKDIRVTADDFDPYDCLGDELIKFESGNNPIINLFNKLAQQRQVDQGQFFHFKDVAIAKLIIEHQSVQVSNLFSNHANDFAEYTEFFQRLGIIHQLIPSTYVMNQATINSRKDRPIDKDRQNIMILCMSKEGHKERFWEQYAKKDTGVCLVFRFTDLVTDGGAVHSWDLRDVDYDEGYQFDFLNEVNHRLSVEFNRILFIEGISKFARFYKRGHYSWENETRLAFDFDASSPASGFLKARFDIETAADNRKYITLPLKGNSKVNPLFTLDIDEVILGYHVSKADCDEIEALLAIKFPNAKIWQRLHYNY